MGMEIKMDFAELADFERQIAAELQPQIDAEVQAGVRAVNERMRGCGDAGAIHAALVSELSARLGDGFHSGDDLDEVSDAIAAGTLEG